MSLKMENGAVGQIYDGKVRSGLTGVLGIHGTEEPRQRVSGGAGHLPAE